MNSFLINFKSLLFFKPKSTLTNTKIVYILLNFSLFLLPLFFNHQLILGIIVNFILIYIAINFKDLKAIPAVFIPSLSVIIRGALISNLTINLIFLLPFIWFSNFIFILSIRYFILKDKSLLLNLVLSSIFKFSIIFVLSYLIINIFNLPPLLLNAMGIMQLMTALSASLIYLIINKKQ